MRERETESGRKEDKSFKNILKIYKKRLIPYHFGKSIVAASLHLSDCCSSSSSYSNSIWVPSALFVWIVGIVCRVLCTKLDLLCDITS